MIHLFLAQTAAPEDMISACGRSLGFYANHDILGTAADFAASASEHKCGECERIVARELGLPVVYVVPEENRETIEKKLGQLNKRAAKLGVPAIRWTFAHDHTQTWKVEKVEGAPEYGYHEYARQWFALTLDGAAAKVPGWTFLATLHHTTEGNIIAAVPGHEVPREFRNADSRCDHCNTIRRRSATYIIQESATGAVKQIGANCLQDFLGNDPARIASWAEHLGAFDAWILPQEEENRGPRRPDAFSLESFLNAVVSVIRVDGWVSKKLAQETDKTATASTAWTWMTILPGSKTEREMTKMYGTEPELDKTTTALVLDWAAAEFGAEATREFNDYEHNLSVVVRSGLVNLRVSGLAASLVQAYRRATQVAEEKKAAAEGPASEFVGAVKERLRLIPVTIQAVIPMPPTEFGPRELVKFKDDSGNVYAWFTGSLGSWMFPGEESARGPKSGDRMWVTGTVKKHSTFQGTKQTELTRCDLASVEPPPAPAKKARKPKKEATV